MQTRTAASRRPRLTKDIMPFSECRGNLAACFDRVWPQGPALAGTPTALLVAELVPGALDGRKWMYIPSTAADCCDDTEAVDAFDKTFPPKEKKWMPSQEEFYIYCNSSVVR